MSGALHVGRLIHVTCRTGGSQAVVSRVRVRAVNAMRLCINGCTDRVNRSELR